MSTVVDSLTKQQLVNELKTLISTYIAEETQLTDLLNADSTNPYSHHAYRMKEYGENKQLRELLEGKGTTKGLIALVHAFDTTSVTITFDPNGCTGVTPDVMTQIPGTLCNLPSVATLIPPVGKQIFGWFTNKTASYEGNTATSQPNREYVSGYKDFVVPKTNITLYAFLGDAYFTLAFDLNGCTGAVPDSLQVKTHMSVTLPSSTGIVAPSGKNVVGWCTTADGSGTLFTFGQLIALDGSFTKLYVKSV